MLFNFLFFGWFLCFMAGCTNIDGSNSASHNVQPRASMTPPNVEKPAVDPTPNLQIITSEKLRCGDSEYDLQKVNNIDRQAYDVRLLKPDGAVANNIDMPNADLFQNFGVNWAKKTRTGFEISVDWGTRIYHEKRFDFVCKRKGFVLTNIKHESFDKHYPEDSKKYKLSTKPVVPNLPLAKFVITDFLID